MANTNISPEQLHRNYIKLAKSIHPDLNPDDQSADTKFQELQSYYATAQKLINKNRYNAAVSITLKESITGTTRYFINDENNKFVLSIPAGVKNHQNIKYRGIAGNVSKDAVLNIKIFIKMPPNFIIVGEQLILKEHVSFWKLYFGGRHQFIGPDGNIILVSIPPKTKNKKIFRVLNAGLFNKTEKKREHLYIQFFGSII